MEAKHAANLVRAGQFSETDVSVLYDALKGNPEYADLLETLAKYAARKADNMAEKQKFDKEKAEKLLEVLLDNVDTYPRQFDYVFEGLKADYEEVAKGGELKVEQKDVSSKAEKNIVVEQAPEHDSKSKSKSTKSTQGQKTGSPKVSKKLAALRTEINQDIAAVAREIHETPKVEVIENAVIVKKKNGSETRFTDSTHATVKPAAEPAVNDFDFIVQRAKVRNQKITLGEKMTDEFRNALIEACAKADVPVTNMTPQQMILYIKSKPAPETSLNSVERPVVAPVVAPVVTPVAERTESEHTADNSQLDSVAAPVAEDVIEETPIAEDVIEETPVAEDVIEETPVAEEIEARGVEDSLANNRRAILEKYREQYSADNQQDYVAPSTESNAGDSYEVPLDTPQVDDDIREMSSDEPTPSQSYESSYNFNEPMTDEPDPKPAPSPAYESSYDFDAQVADEPEPEPEPVVRSSYDEEDNETKQPSKAKRFWDKSKKWFIGAAMVVGMGVLVRACGGGEKKEKDNDRAEFKTEHTAKSSFGADDTIPVVNIEESTPENIVFDGIDGGDRGEQSYDVPLEWNDGLTVTKSRFNRMFSYFPPHDDNNHTNWKNACINSMTHAHNFKLKNGDPMPWDEFFSKTLYLVAHTSKLNGLKCDEHGSMLAHHRDTGMGRAIAGAWRIITCGDTTDVNFEDTQDVLDAVDKKGNIHLTKGLKRLSPQIDVYNHFDPETGILMGDPNNHNIMVEVRRGCDPQVGFEGTGADKKAKEETVAPTPELTPAPRNIEAPLQKMPPQATPQAEPPAPVELPQPSLNIPQGGEAYDLGGGAFHGSEGVPEFVDNIVCNAAGQLHKNKKDPDNAQNDSLNNLGTDHLQGAVKRTAKKMIKEIQQLKEHER